MQKTLNTLRLCFLGVFGLIVVGLWVYQLGWVQPRERCEARHRWWSDTDRVCAIPVSLSVFTGRPNRGEGAPRAALSAGPPQAPVPAR